MKRQSIAGKNQIFDHVRTENSYLLNLGEVVLWVFIEDKLPDWAERVLSVGPDFRKIKNVVTEFLSLLRRHCLLLVNNFSSVGREWKKWILTMYTVHDG